MLIALVKTLCKQWARIARSWKLKTHSMRICTVCAQGWIRWLEKADSRILSVMERCLRGSAAVWVIAHAIAGMMGNNVNFNLGLFEGMH